MEVLVVWTDDSCPGGTIINGRLLHSTLADMYYYGITGSLLSL